MLFLVLIGGSFYFFKNTPFKRDLEFYLVFGRVNGLEIGSPIKYRGILIGKVVDIEIKGEEEIFVKVSINKKYRKLIRVGSEFNLTKESIFSSQRFISLDKIGDPENPTISNGEVIYMKKTIWDKLEDLTDIIKNDIHNKNRGKNEKK